jgi:surface polysaccharide O-acyltransferase-like enzyme
LKAAAILVVVFFHSGLGVYDEMTRLSRPVWGLFNLFNAFARTAVPVFLMVSGRLYLGSTREESAVTFLTRKIPRLLVPFAVWSILFSFYAARGDGRWFSLLEAISDFLHGPTEYHLWFMYAILGIFLVAPMLKVFVRAAPPAEVTYMVVLWYVFIVVQYMVQPAYNSEGPAGTLVGYGGYFLLGYYLDRLKLPPLAGFRFLTAGVALMALNAMEAYRLYLVHASVEDRCYGYLSPGVVLYSAAFFLAGREANWEALYRRWPRLQGAVGWIGAQTFNLYIIHVLFLRLFTEGRLGFRLSENTGGSPLVAVPLLAVLTLVGTALTAEGLSLIPVLNRFLVIRR